MDKLLNVLSIVLLNLLLLLTVLPTASHAANAPTGSRHGQTRAAADGLLLAWNNHTQQWQTVVRFWQHHGTRSGGKHWGQSRTYPRYADVGEHDTFLVEVDSGVCLMEFFHQRWRRANDVHRWSQAHNSHSGCPDVFS